MDDNLVQQIANAKTRAKTSSAKGGNKRAANLTAEERTSIAREAAIARWDSSNEMLPRAIRDGVLEIGTQRIACAVLDTKKRVLTQETFLMAIGRARKASGGKGSIRLLGAGAVEGLPPFLPENLRPFLSDDLLQSATPIVFRTVRGQKAYGYEAELLPKVCNAYLKARDNKLLLKSQQGIAEMSDILVRGLAEVGIIGLIDEATGYQDDRARDELNLILAKYIQKELLPWTEHFPNEFFKQIYRLHGWKFEPGYSGRPPYVGKLINTLVYERLPPGVLPMLRELNPTTSRGRRKHKHFQYLTQDTGNIHLKQQVGMVTMLMRISDTKEDFYRAFNRAFDLEPEQLVLPLTDEESTEDHTQSM